MKSKVALAVAIALAILAAVGIRAYLRQQEQKYQTTRKTVPILIAKTTIKKGVRLTNAMIEDKEVDAVSVQDGRTIFPRNLDKVIGQPILTDVRPGEWLLWTFFAGESSKEDPSAGLTPGYRQITLPVDKVTGCAGRLLPGTLVDVLCTLRVHTSPNTPIESVTQTVLTGMRVMATDLNIRTPNTFLSSRERLDFAAYSTVTLRALPLQAVLLAFLTDQGKIHLIIRSPDDPTGQDPTMIEKVTLDKLGPLIKQASEEKPAAVPAPK